MAITITIPSVKDVATSIKTRVRKNVIGAEFTILAGAKYLAHGVSDKAAALNDKIDRHAVKTLEKL